MKLDWSDLLANVDVWRGPTHGVTPAKAGVHPEVTLRSRAAQLFRMDFRLRRNEMWGLRAADSAQSCWQGEIMKYSVLLVCVFSFSLSGCASSSVTPLSRNTAIISTSAAPVCRTSGAASVANQVAAIATIKAGFARFIVGGFGTTNNTQVVSTGPTYATTTGTFNRFGNTVYGNTNTTFGGRTTTVTGSNEAEMQIVMLNPGDAGYEQGIDARATLGPDWQKKVDAGINNCF